MLGGGAQLKCPGPDRSAPILIVVWKPRRDMAAPWRRKLLSMSRPASACIGLPLIGALHGGGLDDPGVAEQGIQICVAGQHFIHAGERSIWEALLQQKLAQFVLIARSTCPVNQASAR